ncbi:MAG TPA: hypothetical protein ENK57_09500 [Polyangiaceae bacterium]|nr:hypothetical protein [Polyangiaceae bacterium]
MPPAPVRGPTSRGFLDIQWTYPSYTPERKVSQHGESVSVAAKSALPLAEAFRVIAGDDPRPLLVLRECLTCTGTDDALLTRGADNEKTMLLARWFHCVKLAPSVLDENDPFHEVFAGEHPAHLFVSARDGSRRHDLNGQQSRSELWGAMEKELDSSYAKSHGAVLKKLFSYLGKFDTVDQRIAEINGRREDILEKEGPRSRKLAKLDKELAKLRDEKADLRKKVLKVATLPLKKPEKTS